MIHIERATEDDLEAIYAINDACGRLHQRYLEKSLLAREVLIARRDGETAGLATFNRAFFGQPFIDLLLVAPEHRRHGVATALMRHIEKICPEPKLFTSTNDSNLPMQAVCESLGFVRSGWVDNLDDGDPEIIYFKRLSSG